MTTSEQLNIPIEQDWCKPLDTIKQKLWAKLKGVMKINLLYYCKITTSSFCLNRESNQKSTFLLTYPALHFFFWNTGNCIRQVRVIIIPPELNINSFLLPFATSFVNLQTCQELQITVSLKLRKRKHFVRCERPSCFVLSNVNAGAWSL